MLETILSKKSYKHTKSELQVIRLNLFSYTIFCWLTLNIQVHVTFTE